MDQHDDITPAPATDAPDTPVEAPAEGSGDEQVAAEAVAPDTAPGPTDAPAPAGDGADPDPGPDGPAVEATVPAEEPVDGAPTPVAAPAEGPVTAAAHDVSPRPKPVAAKVTPVLVAVAVAWVLKKLLSRNRS